MKRRMKTMNNIIRIFRRDFKKIFTNSMAIVLAVGITVLPSLYAWFNIYANWDPYGSTGNMMVAVVIEDIGYTYKEIDINVGERMEENLKANDLIDWQFVDRDEAVSGIESGKYYAGIEIPEGFSKSFTSILTSNFEKPHITYYANEKKNAIATKITDKVVQTIQTEVNESFIETVVGLMSDVLGFAVNEVNVDKLTSFENLSTQIDLAVETIDSVESTLDSLGDVMTAAQSIGDAINSEDVKKLLDDTDSTVTSTEDVIKITTASVSTITDSVDTLISDTADSLSAAADNIEKYGGAATAEGAAELAKAGEIAAKAKEKIDVISSALKTVNDNLPTRLTLLDSITDRLDAQSAELQSTVDSINTALEEGKASSAVTSIASKLRGVATSITSITNDYNDNVKPAIEDSINSLIELLSDISNLMTALESDMPNLNVLVTSLNASMESGSDMITMLDALLDGGKTQLQNLSDKISNLSDSEIFNTIINLTQGNADELGEFIACPVSVETEKIYGIENYGSAMAPFYSTLAFWVGGMFLIAIFKTDVKHKREIGYVKPYEAYFGRGLIYLFFAVFQGLIICLGDLYFLKIQCYHPFKFILAGVLASLVFSFFLYSLVAAFGDVGKAVGIIMLVVQIGGSGGTFPIDVVPKLFRDLNPYLPFTFVIEAMRECVCGTYENYYWIWLLKLLAYVVVALVIGTFLRFLLKNPVKYMSKQIEKTDIM